MREFTTTSSISADGYTYFGISAEQMPSDLYDPCQLQNEWVKIDGEKYAVLGVDSFTINRSPENPYKLAFCLVTKSVEGDKD